MDVEEIKSSRGKTVLFLLISLAFVAISVAIPSEDAADSYKSWLGGGVFGLCSVVFAWLLIRPQRLSLKSVASHTGKFEYRSHVDEFTNTFYSSAASTNTSTTDPTLMVTALFDCQSKRGTSPTRDSTATLSFSAQDGTPIAIGELWIRIGDSEPFAADVSDAGVFDERVNRTLGQETHLGKYKTDIYSLMQHGDIESGKTITVRFVTGPNNTSNDAKIELADQNLKRVFGDCDLRPPHTTTHGPKANAGPSARSDAS